MMANFMCVEIFDLFMSDNASGIEEVKSQNYTHQCRICHWQTIVIRRGSRK